MVIQAVVEEERPAVNQPVGVGEVDNRMEGKQDRQDKSQVRIIFFLLFAHFSSLGIFCRNSVGF